MDAKPMDVKPMPMPDFKDEAPKEQVCEQPLCIWTDIRVNTTDATK